MYKLGSLAARLMPGPLASAAATSLGFGASFANAERRAMIERHIQRVNPNLKGASLRIAVGQAFDSYARYYVESFRLPSLSKRTVDRSFTVDGFHHITDALDKGNGCIFALPHLGGWEWAGKWMTDQGFRLTVVVEALEPPELFEWFAELRKDLGMTVVSTGPNAGPAVLKALRANEIVCLLCDRDLDRNGVDVEFFGERTTLPAGPATLGLRVGCAHPAGRLLLHPRVQRSPCTGASAAADASHRRPARRRRPHHPEPGPRARVPHPPRPRAVAPLPTELAQRPRLLTPSAANLSSW